MKIDLQSVFLLASNWRNMFTVISRLHRSATRVGVGTCGVNGGVCWGMGRPRVFSCTGVFLLDIGWRGIRQGDITLPCDDAFLKIVDRKTWLTDAEVVERYVFENFVKVVATLDRYSCARPSDFDVFEYYLKVRCEGSYQAAIRRLFLRNLGRDSNGLCIDEFSGIEDYVKEHYFRAFRKTLFRLFKEEFCGSVKEL